MDDQVQVAHVEAELEAGTGDEPVGGAPAERSDGSSAKFTGDGRVVCRKVEATGQLLDAPP